MAKLHRTLVIGILCANSKYLLKKNPTRFNKLVQRGAFKKVCEVNG